MIGLFGEPEKIDSFAAVRFKQTPFLATFIDAKTDRGQDLPVEFLRCRAIPYPKIDVIKKTPAHAHHSFMTSSTRQRRFSRRIINFNPDHVSSRSSFPNSGLSVFSANGAESLAAWGNAPGTRPPTHCLALKARFIWAQTADSIFESRFQRSLLALHESLGRCPRLY